MQQKDPACGRFVSTKGEESIATHFTPTFTVNVDTGEMTRRNNVVPSDKSLEERRYNVKQLYDKGFNIKEIASQLGVHSSSIQRDVRSFQKDNAPIANPAVQGDIEDVKNALSNLGHRIESLDTEVRDRKENNGEVYTGIISRLDKAADKHHVLENTLNRVIKENQELRSAIHDIRRVLREAIQDLALHNHGDGVVHLASKRAKTFYEHDLEEVLQKDKH
jgi:regulator of replication initiation timing|tara:strand:- start:981 stop:1640 length:660 start_codon:yes stop_codon:yes gene_type:complete